MRIIVIIGLMGLLVFFLCRAFENERPGPPYIPVDIPVSSSRAGDPPPLPSAPVRVVVPNVTVVAKSEPKEQYYAIIMEEIITEEVEQ